MAWPGGKDGAGVAQRLINEIPPHDVFLSPFLGDCAILRRKRPARLNIGIDLDRPNVERWARSQFAAPLELYCCDAIEWLRHRFGWYRVAEYCAAAGSDPADRACPDRAAQKGDVAGLAAPGYVAQSSDAGPGGDGSRMFIYCDPPYLMSTRRSGRLYKHEPIDLGDDGEWHAKLLGTLKMLPCQVMVSHYPCELYERRLASWRSFTFAAQTRGGSRVTEQVWCNYPAPAELHDARFLGANKRQREKFRRRRANLKAKLLRLPPLERQGLLEELAITSR
jgi:DNA adenine methylase